MLDGRLDAQRARADALFKESGVKLVYILEGDTPNWSSEYNYGVSNKALAASVLKASLRDGFHVIHTSAFNMTAAAIIYVARELASGGLTPTPVSAAAGVLGKRPRDIRASLPPLVAPLASITGVSLETAELLASKFVTASRLVAASEQELADVTLKSGRRVGNVVAKRVKACFC
jgi:ERCC4-type nuclease